MTYRNGDSIDRRFLDFHYTLPADFHFMDLDGVPFCSRCREPLALVETSRDPRKATRVIYNLAERAKLRAYLILVPDGSAPFNADTQVLIRRVWCPKPEERGEELRTNLQGWAEIEAALRKRHESQCLAIAHHSSRGS
jgi:hypothetical protein